MISNVPSFAQQTVKKQTRTITIIIVRKTNNKQNIDIYVYGFKLLPLNSHSLTFCVDKKIQEWSPLHVFADCN